MAITPRQFLLRVLPWPSDDDKGFINVHVMGTGSDGKKFWSGTPTRDVDQFLKAVHGALQWRTPPDVYMCMSRQAQSREVNGKIRAAKHATDALALKSIFLDIDVGKPPKDDGTPTAYQSIADALDAVQTFCLATTLPFPTALVASGGGLHAHWISQKSLTPDEWRPYALGLKQAALNHGLICDAGVTGDAARVLRVPGTFNYKKVPARPVTCRGLKETDYDFETELAALPLLAPVGAYKAPKDPVWDRSKMAEEFRTLPMDSLAEGIAGERRPVILEDCARECGFIREGLETGGRDFSQGLWNLSALAATFAEDGHELVHVMSKGYSAYSHDETEALWERKLSERADRGLGWPSCKSIQAEGCKHCATCPILALGKSPLNLARVHASSVCDARTPAISSNVRAPLHFDYSKPLPLIDTDLPEGFILRDGRICAVETKEVKGQPPSTKYVEIMQCEVFQPYAQKEPFALNFLISADLGNYVPVSLDQRKLPGTDLHKHLCSQGVLVNPTAVKHLEVFFVNWIDKLHSAAAAAEAKFFGWSRDTTTGELNGFTYGEKTYNTDGTVSRGAMPDKGTREVYTPRGKKEPWLQACKAITDMKRPDLETIIAAGFASPLMVATGQYSGYLAAYGPSGSGKTSAARLALAIWGSPKLAKEGPTSTLRSVLKKTGVTKNLPVVWDEIMDETAQDTVHKAVFVNSLGAEGSRANPDMTIQTKGDWQMISIICSNPVFSDFVMKKNPSTAAGLMRMIEFGAQEIAKDAPGAMPEVDASRMFGVLDYNYGRVGEEYAALIAKNWKSIDDEIVNVQKWYEAQCDLKPAERFWGALAAAIVTGAKLGNMLGAEFDVPAMERFLKDQIIVNRARVLGARMHGGSADNAEELLTAFLKEMIPCTLRVRRSALDNKGVETIQQPGPLRPVNVEWNLGTRQLRISQREFNKWLRLPVINAVPRVTKDGLIKHFHMLEENKSLGAGTTHKQGQETLMVFPVAEGSPLEGLMNAYEVQTGG